MALHVTSHAIERAMERIPGCKCEDDAIHLLSSRAVAQAAEFAPAGSIYVRLATGNRIALEDGHVVTVLPCRVNPRKMSSEAQRYRAWMRAWAVAYWRSGKS